jgi:hypothetical protein
MVEGSLFAGGQVDEAELRRTLSEELRLSVELQRESDPALDTALVQSFVERAEVLLTQRAVELERARDESSARQSDVRENRLVVASASLVFGVPGSVYLWSGDHTVEGFGLWIGIVILNLIFAWRQPRA